MAARIHWRFWERGRTDCAAIEPLLSPYVDGMASAAELRRVEAHLPGCPGCRQALQWMQATRQVIAGRPQAAPPPELRARIARAIAELEAAKTPVSPVRRPLTLRPALAYGASFALLAALGGVFWSAGHHPVVVAVGPPRRPVLISVLPKHSPIVPAGHVSGQRPALSTAPVVASRDTGRSPHPFAHRRVFVPPVVPELAASTNGGDSPTPPKLNSVKVSSRLKASHRLIPGSAALLASRPPVVAPHVPRVGPPVVTPAPHNDRVADAPAPPLLPNTPVPAVRIQPPAITPDLVHTSVLVSSPTVNDTLRGVAVLMQRTPLALTNRTFAANSRTVANNFAVATADSSGTANITEGPVR